MNDAQASRAPGSAIQTRARSAWVILVNAASTFSQIDGTQRAGAFAHFAFFAMFPAIILVVAVASIFVDRDRAVTETIGFFETYVPIGGEKQRYIFDTITGVIEARGQASVIAIVLLGWATMRFFATLIRATTRAWGSEVHDWWRLPLKSLLFLAVAVTLAPLGMAVPVLAEMATNRVSPLSYISPWVYAFGRIVLPMLAVFLSLSLFYKLAPRRHTRFAEVWVAALCASLLLLAAKGLFGIYLKHFATLNAVYGAFGGIMALLLWIYVSGCIAIFGACLCAAQAAEQSRK